MTIRGDSAKPVSRTPTPFWVGLFLIGLLAVACRIIGALNGLWLDEILAVNLAGQVGSPLDVFTQLHSEINHHLYTLYLAWIGHGSNFFVMRLPSLVAGVGSLIFAGLIARRQSRPACFFALLLFGFSYVLVLFSGEARGYALAVFFALACFWLLERFFLSNRLPTALLFSFCAALGILSQMVFLCFFFAALLWSLVRWLHSRSGTRRGVVDLLCCYTLPCALLVLLYFVDLRKLVNLGGTPSSSLFLSLSTSLVWTFGFPPVPFLPWLVALSVVGFLGVACFWFWRKKSDLWVFFPGVILLFPVLLVLARGSMVIYARYFIVGNAFLLLLVSYGLGALYQRNFRGKVLSVLLILVFLLANGWQISKLFRFGRGQYREALRFMSQHATTHPFTVGSDHDFRNFTILQFYVPSTLSATQQLLYFPTGKRPPLGPEWVIRHKESFDAPIPPEAELADSDNNRYELVAVFPSAPLSGLHWFIYHNKSVPLAPAP